MNCKDCEKRVRVALESACVTAKQFNAKITDIWHSGRKGKIGLVACGVGCLVVLNAIFCGERGGAALTFDDLLSHEYRSAEDLAKDIVAFDMARHWDDFHKPLNAKSFRLRNLVAGDRTISFEAIFEPNADEYFVRVDTINADRPSNLSISLNREMEAKESYTPYPDAKTAKRLNELARNAVATLPELYVFRKLTPSETNREGFEYKIEYGVRVILNKKRRYTIDDGYDGGKVESVLYVGQNDRRFFEISQIGVTREYLNGRKDVFPILATGRTESDWLSGKWLSSYNAYRRVGDAVWNDFSKVAELQSKTSYYGQDEAGRKANNQKIEVKEAIRETHKICDEIERVLTNLPKIPRL